MLPPIVRRLFSSSPIAAPLLLVLAITMLFLGVHPRTREHVVPSGWVGGSGIGGAVSVGKEKIYDHDAPAANHQVVAAPPPEDDDERLPQAYSRYFPNRVLPAEFDAVPALAARLGDFLRRPILSHEDAWNASIEHCPPIIADNLINPDRLKSEKGLWEVEVDEHQVAHRRAELVKYLARRIKEGENLLGKEGTRGIVMTAGNRDTTTRLITSLRVFKKLGVTLPVEVFHYPSELHDQSQREEIEKLGATLVQVRNVQKRTSNWKNWQIKAFALIQSSFSEILYLDSDNIPLRDPTHLFDTPMYLHNGHAAFWPDISKEHPSNAIWRIVGQSCSLNEWSFESGQMVISKAGNRGLNLAALHIAAGMADEETRDFWFRLNEGDKDTFRWAFRILDIQYAAAPRWLSALGFTEKNGDFCGHTTLQYDLVTPKGYSAPPPLFVHSNLLKHLGGLGWGGQQTAIFSQIKRMVIDDSSDNSLNAASMFVRHGGTRVMCLDLKAPEPDAEADKGKHATGGAGINRVFLEQVDQVEGEPFKGFEDMLRETGGRIGGWDAAPAE